MASAIGGLAQAYPMFQPVSQKILPAEPILMATFAKWLTKFRPLSELGAPLFGGLRPIHEAADNFDHAEYGAEVQRGDHGNRNRWDPAVGPRDIQNEQNMENGHDD